MTTCHQLALINNHDINGEIAGRKVVAVTTACGQRIVTSHVVNAAGAWGGSIAAMVGAELPLRAMKHAFVVTEPLEGMHGGLPNVRDHDLSIYLKAQVSEHLNIQTQTDRQTDTDTQTHTHTGTDTDTDTQTDTDP